MNMPLLAVCGLVGSALVWSTFRRPALGIGLLLAFLPVLSFARRFEGSEPWFPSLETLAVLLVWAIALIRRMCSRGRWPASQGDLSRPGSSSRITHSAFWGLLFLVAGVASSLVSRDPGLSLRILFTGGLVPLLVFSIAAESDATWKDLRPVVWGILALAVQVGIYTALTFRQRLAASAGGELLYSWMYNQANSVNIFVVPSVAVSVVVPAIPLAAWYFLHGSRSKRNLVAVAIVVSVLLAILLSLSRGSWLGAAVAVIASLPLVFRKVRLAPVLLGLGIVALLYSLGLLDVAREVIASRMGNGQGLHNVDVRSANFILALQATPKYLLSGLGLGQYSDIYAVFPYAQASLLPPLWFAHNLLLTLIPEIGLVGALAFAVILLDGTIRGLRMARPAAGDDGLAMLGYALAVGVLSFLIIASTAGAHLVTYLENSDGLQTHFMSSALVVAFLLLGTISALDRKLKRVRTAKCELETAQCA
jgi:hypothetical protein